MDGSQHIGLREIVFVLLPGPLVLVSVTLKTVFDPLPGPFQIVAVLSRTAPVLHSARPENVVVLLQIFSVRLPALLALFFVRIVFRILRLVLRQQYL